MKNIFVNCSISNIKIKNSNLYIARLHISYHVDGEYSSKVIHIESDSPQENSLNALELFNIECDKFRTMYSDELFSSVNIKSVKYRGFQVFTTLSLNNLIKKTKGA